MQTRKKGAIGEAMAASYLEERGFFVLEKNYFTKNGEIDIIFMDADTLVFAEVKYRKGRKYGTPAEAVTPKKIKKISMGALSYLYENGLSDTKCRFDVLEVTDGQINHLQNAFEAVL